MTLLMTLLQTVHHSVKKYYLKIQPITLYNFNTTNTNKHVHHHRVGPCTTII